MPLKLSVTISKKIGQPDFGSLGATCSIEVELPHSIVFDDLEAFHRHARNVYVAATQAVNDELARQQAAEKATQDNGHSPATNGRGAGHSNGNGHKASNGRKATASQIRAIHAIINRQGLDLVQTLRDRYGVEYAEDLSISQASTLIDELKAKANGAGERR